MFTWLKTLFCKHEFNGAYDISATRQVVEMPCDKCKKKHSWSFAEWQKLTQK